MKILVYLDPLEITGSHINALDLARSMQELGHETVIFARPESLAQLVTGRGLRLLPAATWTRPRPGPQPAWALARILREEPFDLVHSWGEGPCVEAFYGGRVLSNLPVLATVMSMSIPCYLPDSVPLTVGTPALAEEVKGRPRRGPVFTLQPPIDTNHDNPSFDGADFARRYGFNDGRYNLVLVSRISPLLKLEGLERAIQAVTMLAERLPVRLIIAGTGLSYARLQVKAERANQQLGWPAIVLTGPLLDPRPAYAIADVVLGMGSSIMRAMAFGKPAVCLGEQGFSEIVSPSTIDLFLHQGFYGLGDGDRSPNRLQRQLEALLTDPVGSARLGDMAMQIVHEQFSLLPAARRLEAIYRSAIEARPSRADVAFDAISTARQVASDKAGTRARLARDRLRWRVSVPA